jgi:hypothetical protein
LVTQAILPANILPWGELAIWSVEIADRIVCVTALASLLPQRSQKQHDADPGENNGDGKACARDLAAVMIICFEMPGEAYQKSKNANAERNQPNRALVVIGNFHWQRQSNIAGSAKFKCAL